MVWSLQLNLHRKGLSDVISTVLTITLTVIAIAIVAGMVIPFVRDSLNSSTECIGYKEYVTFKDLGYNCQNDGKVYLTLSAGQSEKSGNIGGIRVVVFSGSNSEVFEIKNGAAESCGPGGVRSIGNSCTSLGNIKVINSGETNTYVYNSTEGRTFDSAEVYLELSSGRVCERSDSLKISACSGATQYNE